MGGQVSIRMVVILHQPSAICSLAMVFGSMGFEKSGIGLQCRVELCNVIPLPRAVQDFCQVIIETGVIKSGCDLIILPQPGALRAGGEKSQLVLLLQHHIKHAGKQIVCQTVDRRNTEKTAAEIGKRHAVVDLFSAGNIGVGCGPIVAVITPASIAAVGITTPERFTTGIGPIPEAAHLKRLL